MSETQYSSTLLRTSLKELMEDSLRTSLKELMEDSQQLLSNSANTDYCLVTYKKPVGILPVSGSAQDFRALDAEKERQDKFSPRGVLEDCISSSDSETNSSKTSTSEDEVQPNEVHPSQRAVSHWREFFRLIKNKSRKFPTFPNIKVPKCPRLKGTGIVKENHASILNPPEDPGIPYRKSSWKTFMFNELQTATGNFNPDNVIGKGGYAQVYKGCLEDGTYIAVKRLTRGTAEERSGDFLSELGIIVHVNHPNIAKLIGYGVDGGMHIVLQLSPHGSLASLLHGSSEKLGWSVRYKIALGTAHGLVYLHDSCQRRIIHRDIKTANILLTEDFEPQICDFGLAKWLPKQWTHHTVSKFEGTFGYLAPEYFMHGIVNEKTDVFAFGVLLLELISGRQALDNTQQSLVMWAKPFLEKNDIRELADPALADIYDAQQMSRMASTASLCIQHSSMMRPRMDQVVQLLKGDEISLDCVKKFKRPFHQRTYSEEIFDAEEYNSTRNLSDINRLRQIAFEF